MNIKTISLQQNLTLSYSEFCMTNFEFVWGRSFYRRRKHFVYIPFTGVLFKFNKQYVECDFSKQEQTEEFKLLVTLFLSSL